MAPLRILSFNIHGGYDWQGHRDLKRVHALLNRQEIDIAVVQEMETRPRRGGTLKDVETLAGDERPYHLPGPTLKEGGGWYGNLLVSKYPIERGLVHNLETQPLLEPRNAVDALINTPKGKFRVVGTHLSLSSMVRWSEIQNLIRLMDSIDEEAKHPLLFMGDFNEWLWSSRLLRHMNNIMTPLPCQRSFPSFFPLLKLDRAWFDTYEVSGLHITARILKDPVAKGLSDHLPLLIEIR